MDKDTRNLLANTTQAVRRALEEEFRLQLEGTFDVHEDGRIEERPGAPLDDKQKLVRRKIISAIEHRRSMGESDAESVRGFLREAAFTLLNRLAALKMMEARGIVLECVSACGWRDGKQDTEAVFEARGFKEFSGLAPGLIELPDKGYRLYLECLFDEIGREVGVLFDRTDSASLLWPRRKALADALTRINAPGLVGIWTEDETIGWIYQYYNDPAERRQMRDESAAPRNSREMAVRNQFFTPRYVVEFLTDNALGRLWYEMTKGQTQLKERCRYLIRQTSEVFLGEGEKAPTADMDAESVDTDLRQRTLHIAHRPLKDPREIRMLDPACGSMHFGLYTFDLLEVIYSEAWDMAKSGQIPAGTHPSFAKFVTLTATFDSKESFLREVPRFIIEHNIHGIDIDPRAAQMAGLAMWLRAQRAWQSMGLKPVDRPTIRRSNIVCAEPMPGEKELLSAFVTESFRASEQPFFQKLLDAVFEKMQIAGEAGALLQIEEEIRFLVHEAREAWKQLGKRSGELFSEAELARADQRTGTQLKLDLGSWSLDSLSGIPDAEFWEQAEGRIYEALRTFAERAESSSGFQRRLFAEDAARGFAFIDLCRQRYDVALMNPPFGDASIPSKPYIEKTYGDTKGDVYKAFVECFETRLVPAGYLGIISSRTGFFLSQSEDWRTRVVLRLFRPIALADLGGGVLDAMVEVAAYVLRSLSAGEARDLTQSIVPVLEKVGRDKQDRFSLPKWQSARGGLKRHQAVAELEHLEAHGFIQRSSGDAVRYSPLWPSVKKVTAPPDPVFPPLVCVRTLDDTAKGEAVLEALSNCQDYRKFVTNSGAFFSLPGTTFAYWASPSLLQTFTSTASLQDSGFEAWVGLQTNQDFRWLRLIWEVCETVYPAPANRGEPRCWLPFAKGGEYSPFYSDIHLAVLWGTDGRLLKEWKKEEFRRGRITENNSQCWNEPHYKRLGLTWPRRSQIGLSVRVMPAGCLFGDKGPGIFTDDASPTRLLAALGVANSTPFKRLVALQMAFGSFEVGVLRRTPYPRLSQESECVLGSAARKVWAEKRWLDTIQSTSNAFLRPALLASPGSTLAERAAAWAALVRTSAETVAAIQAEIDDLTFRLYGLDAADRAALTSTLATEATGDADAESGEDEEEEAVTADAPALAADLLAYALGCTFGRWDIRYATGERPAPPAPDPFAPLPVCPPGMLQNDHGLPATPADVPTDYPLRITWPGILVDDPGHPEHDIGSRLQEVLERLFPERPDAIEQEACELLGVKSLRDWFRKPTGFFADHLKRYSKSRRQAPIYWPLSSPKGLYTIWIYYHRLNADTLFTALRDFLEPKLQYEEQRAFQLKQEAGPTPSPSQRRDIIEADDLVDDLRALKDELNRVAPLFRPDLNDGVILNCAPLWRMMALPKWQKDCKAAWDSLSKDDYDWAHLALHLWPERVIPKCATDRSLAIAHGLEDTFWEITPEDELPKKQQGKGTLVWRSKKVSSQDLQTLITTHTSPAIKAALEELAKAPVAGGWKKGRKSRQS